MLMSCSLCLAEKESRIINVLIPVVSPARLKTRTVSQMQQHLFILTLKTVVRLLPLPSHMHTNTCVWPRNQMFM